jgi:hypothetical protein
LHPLESAALSRRTPEADIQLPRAAGRSTSTDGNEIVLANPLQDQKYG